MQIIAKKIKDRHVLWLLKIIITNHNSEAVGKGMPIGNLTSQFFANVYLNELDWFVKHKLKVKYYIRYVDDFVILHKNKATLTRLRAQINNFLLDNLKVELHPEKTRIIKLINSTTFLGFRIFQDYQLLKKSNARRIWKRIALFKQRYNQSLMNREEIRLSIEGWIAYASFANTYSLRKKVTNKCQEIIV